MWRVPCEQGNRFAQSHNENEREKSWSFERIGGCNMELRSRAMESWGSVEGDRHAEVVDIVETKLL